jgi:hypothetical protein
MYKWQNTQKGDTSGGRGSMAKDAAPEDTGVGGVHLNAVLMFVT